MNPLLGPAKQTQQLGPSPQMMLPVHSILNGVARLRQLKKSPVEIFQPSLISVLHSYNYLSLLPTLGREVMLSAVSVRLFVCTLARLCTKLSSDSHETFYEY